MQRKTRIKTTVAKLAGFKERQKILSATRKLKRTKIGINEPSKHLLVLKTS